MFNYKGIPCACPYCCGVDLVKPGYPNKLVLKLTVSLLLLWLWSVHDHYLPVFIWLWLPLSLLHKSLKKHSLQQFVVILCFFHFSSLYAMKPWFEFKHWLFVLVIIFHIFQLEGMWWQDFSPVMGKKAELAWRPSHPVSWICRSGMWLNSIFWINTCLIPFLEN